MTYQLFNVFGTMRIERSRIVCLATAFSDAGKAVERTVDQRLDQEQVIAEIGDGESVAISFASYLEQGKRPQVLFQQLSARLGGPNLLHNKQVRAALKQVLDQF